MTVFSVINILNSDLMYIIKTVVTDLTDIIVLFFFLHNKFFLNNIRNNWIYSVFLINTSSDGSGSERCSVYICDTATINDLDM